MNIIYFTLKTRDTQTHQTDRLRARKSIKNHLKLGKNNLIFPSKIKWFTLHLKEYNIPLPTTVSNQHRTPEWANSEWAKYIPGK